jgi:enoyl-CoA hydratase/carnithine racemase
MEEYRTILVEKKPPVGIVTLNRPKKLNAINLQMKKELSGALSLMESDGDIKAVILTGAGKAFSSGFDNGDSPENLSEFLSLKEEALLFNLDIPTIAAIHGYTLGDALQQALLCDIVIASENAILGFVGPQIGGLCYASFTVLPAVVGRHRANKLLLACEQISAQEGYRIGLVNKVVFQDQLMTAAIDMAHKIARWPQKSITYTKRALRTALANDAHKAAVAEGWRAILGDLTG